MAEAIGSILQTEYQGLILWELRQGYHTKVPEIPGIADWRSGADEGLLGTANMPPETGPDVLDPAYFAEQHASKMIHDGDQVVAASSDRIDLTVYAVKEQDGHGEGRLARRLLIDALIPAPTGSCVLGWLIAFFLASPRRRTILTGGRAIGRLARRSSRTPIVRKISVNL